MNMKWTIASYQVSSWLNLSIYLQQLLGSQIRVSVTKITEKNWFSEIIWSWTTYPWYFQGCRLSISHCILMRSETLLSVTIQASSPFTWASSRQKTFTVWFHEVAWAVRQSSIFHFLLVGCSQCSLDAKYLNVVK